MECGHHGPSKMLVLEVLRYARRSYCQDISNPRREQLGQLGLGGFRYDRRSDGYGN
jgi:hypothetical protein